MPIFVFQTRFTFFSITSHKMTKNNEQEKLRIRAHNEAHFAKLDFPAIKAELVKAGFETVEIADDVEESIMVEDGKGCNANIVIGWDAEKKRYTGELFIEVHDWPGMDEEEEDILPQVQDTMGLDHNACETPEELADYVADWRDALLSDPETYNSY